MGFDVIFVKIGFDKNRSLLAKNQHLITVWFKQNNWNRANLEGFVWSHQHVKVSTLHPQITIRC